MRTNLILRAAALAVAFSGSAFAASRTWTGNTSGLWSDPTNWDGGVSIPASGDDLIFSTSPNLSITIDVPAPTVGAIQFTVSGGGYSFGPTGSSITLGGNIFANAPLGPTNVETFNSDLFTGGNPQNFTGAPTIGPVTVNGAISGGGLITVSGGIYTLVNAANSYTGGTSITGGTLEIAANNANIGLLGTGASRLGTGGTLTLNASSPGGQAELRISPGTGQILNDGSSRAITFGPNGGTVFANGRIANTNVFNIVTSTAAGASPAVLRFNGGPVPYSNNAADSGWNNGVNALRLGITNAGPIRAELLTGAMFVMPNLPTINNVLTVRGVVGGDPTSGALGTVHTGISQTTGRFDLPGQATYTMPNGLFLEDAIQVAIEGAARAVDGNITIRGSAGGHAGYVAFAGRGTGTAFGTGAINEPGIAVANLSVLWLGRGGNDLLTIEDGGTAVLDLRIRSDLAFNHPVLLNSRAVINAGGTLAFRQSISNFSPIGAPVQTPTSPNGVGYHIVQGNIEGQGNSAKDSIVDIALPFDNVATDNQPLGGVEFQASSNIVVNGTGNGGLLVKGTARPNALFSGGTPDPVSNADKVANFLSGVRMAALTGTGGYLTPAPQGATFNFPAAGEWAASVPVGLKVIDNNAGGADVALAAAFNHNVLLSGGDLAAAGNSFGGVLWGAGTVSGSFNMAATGTFSPGQGVGTIISNGDALLINDSDYIQDITGAVAGSQYDRLTVNGGVTLDSDLNIALTFYPTAGMTFTIISNDGSEPVNGIFNGLPEAATFSATNLNDSSSHGFRINYGAGDGNDVVLTALGVVPEPASMALAATGMLGLTIRRRRR